MDSLTKSTEYLNEVLEDSLYHILLPNVLKIIMPVLILGCVYVLLKMFVRRNCGRKMAILLEGILTILFLLVGGMLVSFSINHIEIPKESFPSEESSEITDPFQAPDLDELMGDDFSDPFQAPDLDELMGDDFSDPFQKRVTDE